MSLQVAGALSAIVILFITLWIGALFQDLPKVLKKPMHASMSELIVYIKVFISGCILLTQNELKINKLGTEVFLVP